MTAFGVVLVFFGILSVWAGIKQLKLNEVLQGFIGQPTAQSKPAKTTTA